MSKHKGQPVGGHISLLCKLEKCCSRPLGPRYSPGIQSGAKISPPPTSRLPQFHLDHSIILDEVGRLEPFPVSGTMEWGLSAQYLWYPKQTALGGQWLIFKLHVVKSHFKMESIRQWRLAGQAQPQECLSHHPKIHRSYRKCVFKVSVAGPALGVQCPLWLRQNNEGSSGGPKEARYKIGLVSGWHTDDGRWEETHVQLATDLLARVGRYWICDMWLLHGLFIVIITKLHAKIEAQRHNLKSL